MATPDWIGPDQEIVGASHPTRPDTKNSVGMTINTMMLVEHDANGRHLTQHKSQACVGEINTYTGDGNASIVITLSNSTLDPKLCIVWADEAINPAEKIDTMSGDISFARQTIASSSWMSFSTGQFTIKHTDWNTNLETYYYLVLGTDTTGTYTGDAGAGSDPTWVTSGNLETAPMIGSDDSTVSQITNSANTVESEIWTAFIHEHTVAGVHNPNPYAAYGKIESGTYAGTNADDRNISLTYAIDIQYLIIVASSATAVATRSETMAGDNSKVEDTAAFQADRIQSIGTGTFQVGITTNTTGRTYYWIAIGE